MIVLQSARWTLEKRSGRRQSARLREKAEDGGAAKHAELGGAGNTAPLR